MIGAIIGAVAGGLLSANGAKRAASAQQASANEATAEQRRQFDIAYNDAAPYREAGVNALGRLQDPNAFQQSPGFNFLRQQGMQGIERSAAARGGAASGNALKALAEFQTGLAQQDYGNWWNRQAGMAGIGQAATTNTNILGANMANNVGNNLMAGGDARASGIVGQANALGQGISGAVDAWNYFRRPTMNTGGGWSSGGTLPGGSQRPPWMTPPFSGDGPRYG